jgi:hypothetical protein
LHNQLPNLISQIGFYRLSISAGVIAEMRGCVIFIALVATVSSFNVGIRTSLQTQTYTRSLSVRLQERETPEARAAAAKAREDLIASRTVAAAEQVRSYCDFLRLAVRLTAHSLAMHCPRSQDFNAEETAALTDASKTVAPAWQGPKAETPVSLKNPFGGQLTFFNELRHPTKDPTAETWEAVRTKWPVLAARSDEELLIALEPIKAVYVDMRSCK